MAKDWRCLIGLHDWREVEMPDRDKCAECTRCGKRDWRRLLTRTAGQWRGGDPPPGSLRGVGTQTRVTPRCHGPISSTCLARSGNPAAHSYAAIRALDCRRSVRVQGAARLGLLSGSVPVIRVGSSHIWPPSGVPCN